MRSTFEGGEAGGRSGEARPIRPRRPSTSRASSVPESYRPADRATWLVETGIRPVRIVSFRSRWVTAADERTCPVCAPLHGQIFTEGEGPYPPLHRSCRCARVDAGIEISSRES